VFLKVLVLLFDGEGMGGWGDGGEIGRGNREGE